MKVLHVNGYTIKPRANLYGANLEGADLRLADLREADLRFANLRDANLTGADLRGADLLGTSFLGANLTFTDITLPKGWYIYSNGLVYRDAPTEPHGELVRSRARQDYKERRKFALERERLARDGRRRRS